MTVLMPSRYSSDHSITDAEDLVKRQGIHGRTVPIRGMVEAYEAELDLTGLAAENLQARVRGNILMGLSNEHPISKMVAAARAHRYAMGVSEMQRQTIIRSL